MSITITGITETIAALSAVQAVVAAPFAVPGVEALAAEFAAELQDLLRGAAPRREEVGRPGSFFIEPGEFADTIAAVGTSSGQMVTIEAMAENPIMDWIVEGTPPHPIEPHRPPRWLRFPFTKIGVDPYFAQHVDHPGTKPNPFQEEPALVVIDEMLAAYGEAIAAEIARVAAS